MMPTDAASHPALSSESGLTLLEVLASAMIFAMVMTVLIGTSSTAVHNVGMSARRLEANLIADEILADLEIQMKRGIAPEISDSEPDREFFAVQTTRADLVTTEPAAPDEGDDITSMLSHGLPEVAKHLKQYDIEVSWIEQSGTHSVTRTTFAYDWELAAVEFAGLFARPDGTGGASGIAGRNGQSEGAGTPLTNGRISNPGNNQLTAEQAARLLDDPSDALGPRRRASPCDGHNARRSATGCVD